MKYEVVGMAGAQEVYDATTLSAALLKRTVMIADGRFNMIFIRQYYGREHRFRVLHRYTWRPE